MRITSIDFAETGHEHGHPTHILGVITITLSNGRRLTFANIRQDDWNAWYAARFDPERSPWPMRPAFMNLLNDIIEANAIDQELELALDDEAALRAEYGDEEPEDESDDVFSWDPIGAHTGIRSPGCGRIRGDDFLGRLTGIASPGYPPIEIIDESDDDDDA